MYTSPRFKPKGQDLDFTFRLRISKGFNIKF